ncbi:pirin family protein [Musicola paradisiaca]|uniref:Pirin domain protein n=1 Tax=Musicola paradisiaca (strain Ech703) TaxID=579405 RepID=C6CE64_MUSP7|nr:pirin family protein [Musicola paradisiaca]ACS87158.1 Pirin domain protein [Musicola paradisiaca Ech703]
MIISRVAEQCGQADYGWLQARYTFSFGHYFDPDYLGFASLRVLNQEVLSPKTAFQPRTYPRVDILNILLQGRAEYRDSNGAHIRADAGDVLLLATQPGISYSEHNIDDTTPLTRLQLWLDACPTRENSPLQRLTLQASGNQLIASPEDTPNALHLRQQVWIHHVDMKTGEQQTLPLKGNSGYLQSIYGSIRVCGCADASRNLHCGDGAFIQQEKSLTLQAGSDTRALLIDLVA